jgi:two-component system response regulator DesR
LIRLLLADDQELIRSALAIMLALEEDFEVVAAVGRGDEVAAAAREHRPDVALLDIGLPGVDGITAAAELSGRLPGCRVLILTGLDAPGNLTAALAAGVSGYLLKDGPAEGLIRAIRAVAGGEQVIDTRLAR